MPRRDHENVAVPHDDHTFRRAGSFGSLAVDYERFRPGYPSELFADVLVHVGSYAEQGVLDIGAGTGKASLPLATAGLQVTAVEPAPEMAAVLHRRARESGLDDRITIRIGTFESMEPTDGPFGLVVAAQSFHWTDPETRWRRLVDAMAPGGVAALLWNRWVLDGARHDLALVRRVYAEHHLDLVPDVDVQENEAWPANEISETRELTPPAEGTYTWTWELRAEAYRALLCTTSQYAVLPAGRRDRLLDDLAIVLGDGVTLRGWTELVLTRREVSQARARERDPWRGVTRPLTGASPRAALRGTAPCLRAAARRRRRSGDATSPRVARWNRSW